jgi:hypothetical protein
LWRRYWGHEPQQIEDENENEDEDEIKRVDEEEKEEEEDWDGSWGAVFRVSACIGAMNPESVSDA